ncbi:MAG: hypothetical protein KME46_29610 [Brasilonema angustatum HA4187-MV1]|jgi:hypothetical protein|nr:hypothetical protein [Brasilonema angustatum HA4187-MV1]
MSKLTVYKLYHWWEGDHVSSPGWVRTATDGELRSLEEVTEVIMMMRRQGWTDFKIFKHTIEPINPNTLCPPKPVEIPTAPTKTRTKKSVK